MRLIRMIGILAGVVAGFAAAPAVAAAWGTPATGSVVMYSDPGFGPGAIGDFIGLGQQHVYTNANASITLSGGTTGVGVYVNTAQGDEWSLVFTAPNNQTLTPGMYVNVGENATDTAGSMEIDGDGRACNVSTGQFQIADLGYGSDGNIDRISIIYEQHCEGGPSALFGELRINEPPSSTGLDAAPGVVRWSDNAFKTPETVVPVQFTAAAPISVDHVTVGGDDPAQFTINSDGCSGRTLAAGDACTVQMQSTPTAPGLTQAELHVTDARGDTTSVPLQGWTDGGTTSLTLDSQPSDPVAYGQHLEFTPANAYFYPSLSASQVGLQTAAAAGQDWNAFFAPGGGARFTSGTTYTGAQRWPFAGSAPGLSLWNTYVCNTLTGQFTVTDAEYAADGTLKGFGVQFSQNCDGDPSESLSGTFDYKVGDDVALPFWMLADGGAPSSPSGGGSSTVGSGSGGTGSGGSGAVGSGTTTGTEAPPSDAGETDSSASGPVLAGGAGGSSSPSGPATLSNSSVTSTADAGITTSASSSAAVATRRTTPIPRAFARPTTARVIAAALRTIVAALTADVSDRTSPKGMLRSDLASANHLMSTYRPESASRRALWTRVRADLARWFQEVTGRRVASHALALDARRAIRDEMRLAALLRR